MTLPRLLTFLLGSLTVTLLTLVFFPQWCSLHWEILMMLLYQFPLTFHKTQNEMLRFIAKLMPVLVLIGTVFVMDCPPYSGGTDRPGELCYNFPISVTLLRWLTFQLGSLTVILRVLLFWISFFLLILVFFLQWLSLHWEILIMLLYQFSLTFHPSQNEMLRFIAKLMTILVLIEIVFVII